VRLGSTVVVAKVVVATVVVVVVVDVVDIIVGVILSTEVDRGSWRLMLSSAFAFDAVIGIETGRVVVVLLSCTVVVAFTGCGVVLVVLPEVVGRSLVLADEAAALYVVDGVVAAVVGALVVLFGAFVAACLGAGDVRSQRPPKKFWSSGK
jgi:hypothetical protein